MPIENNIEEKENPIIENNSSNNELANEILKEVNKASSLENLENLDKSKNVNSNNVNSNNVIYQGVGGNLLRSGFIIIFTLLILILLFFMLAYMNGGDIITR